MSPDPESLKLTRPPGFRLPQTQKDLRTLFSKLADIVKEGGALHTLPKALAHLWEGQDAVQRQRTPEEQAWQLVRNALTRAIGELLDEWARSHDPIPAGRVVEIGPNLDHILGGLDGSIGAGFFRDPTGLPLLATMKQCLARWLTLHGAHEQDAAMRAARLPSYFAVALHDEWRLHPGAYDAVERAFRSPFAGAVRMERDWERYRHWLIRQFDLPVFEESFGLSQIYVPLRACYRETVRSSKREEKRSVVVDIEIAVLDWLAKADRDDAVRVVRGGPGNGKSTLAKWLAAELSRDPDRLPKERRLPGDLRVLFLPLQRFRIRGRLADAVGEGLCECEPPAFERNPLERGSGGTDRPLLLIFDGLDELSKPGDLADKETRLFLDELRRFLELQNQESCRVFALITGRTAAIQASQDALKLKEGRELEVLRFLVTDGDILTRKRSGWPFHDPGKRLSRDQRQRDWWPNYRTCKPGQPDEIPSTLLRDDVEDLSAEPLLLYLLVLSGFHKAAARTEPVNRNVIYAKLFEDVAARRHAGGEPLAATVELGSQFPEVMEEIATAAWYGDGRTATVDDIRRHCDRRLRPALDKFLDDDVGFSRLVVAFFCQKTETQGRRRDSRDALEFTHKSFGEYLTARRMVRTIADIHTELSKNHRKYGEAEALDEWFQLCRHRAMDWGLLRFLRDEIALHDPDTEVAGWQQTLTRLMSLCIRDGMPFKPTDDLTFRVAEQQARNAEESLLAALNGCALTTKLRSELAWPDIFSLGLMINRLRGQRYTGEYSISLDCLSFINTIIVENEGCVLEAQDFLRANFDKSSLRGASFCRSDISGASFIGADLRETNFNSVFACDANFADANFSAALIGTAYLDRTNFENSTFKGLYLGGANLENAIGLTQDQLDKADGNPYTSHPPNLVRPSHWPPAAT